MIFSLNVLESVITAEATIIGLFGIVAAYMLASYGNRVDRILQQEFDLKLTSNEAGALQNSADSFF